jgi:tetratricopeptide (TPR) repeat protein
MISRWSPIPRLVPGVAVALLLGALSLGLTSCSQKTPEERLEEAVLMLQQGQLARAVLELRTIVRENPGDPAAAQARMVLARYYVREGNANRAIEELEAVYKQYGRAEQIGRDAADALMSVRSQIGDLEGAVKLADEAIASVSADEPERLAEYKLLRATILIDQATEESIAEGRQVLRTMMLEAGEPWQRGQAREILANTYRSTQDFEGSNAVYTEYLAAFPEDRIRSRLELAMAVNVISAGETEKGRADFDTAAAKLLAEAEQELDAEQKTTMLQELAAFHQSIKDLEGAEKVMLQIMASNPMSMTAIQTQFGIAQMYLNSGILEESDAHFDKGIALLEQIQKENPNTNIAMTAENMVTQFKQAREDFRTQKAEAEKAAAQPEAPPSDAEPPTAEQPADPAPAP